MNTKDAYQKKVEAELELVHAKLITWKAKVKVISADANIEFDKQIVDLEHRYNKLKDAAKELGSAGEDTLEKIKAGIEGALESMSSAVMKIAKNIKD